MPGEIVMLESVDTHLWFLCDELEPDTSREVDSSASKVN